MLVIIKILNVCFEKSNKAFDNKSNIAIQINCLNYFRLKINNQVSIFYYSANFFLLEFN